MTLFIGTSGWQYRDWRGRFYPRKLAQRDWLAHYAAHFQVVEVNNTFYRLPEASTFESWAKKTPDDFVFAIKASRYLTHILRLRNPAEPVSLMLERERHLGPKLGPVLLQLPPNLQADLARLGETLSAFPAEIRVAVEFRHRSWYSEETRRMLEKWGTALCLADRGSRLATPLWGTTDWTYVRMHSGAAFPPPSYGRGALDSWVRRVADGWSGNDAYVLFNNDTAGWACRDSAKFAALAKEVGLRPTRTPSEEAWHRR